jgi:hypothetical protein
VLRPFVQEALGAELEYNYFCSLLTDYEQEQGNIPLMTRDARGAIYHPHTGEEIQLGTVAAEDYERPAWTFNKILYSEKEGLFSMLRSVDWPERHDCALVTSKGFASRAVRDVLDHLAESGEPVTIFCIHDADAYGTMIYQALQEETRARPGRAVQIINLGLEPDEALAMGLPVEQLSQKDRQKRHPVARYVDPAWAAWLQTQRVELNAMTAPQFLLWLDRKMVPYDQGKMIPPPDVLTARLEAEARAHLTAAITARVLAEARVTEQVAAALRGLAPQLTAHAARLPSIVGGGLADKPTASWSDIIGQWAAAVVAAG